MQKSIAPISYIYFALFFISGISGLIYESVWSQYLKQFLGHAAYSQTLVLVIYMGGMAIGAWIVSSWASKKQKNLLFAYGIAEIILGIFALVFHNIFLWYLDISFTTVIPFLGQPLPVSAYKWITAALIILPQSMLLGATFPLMAGGMLRRFPGLSGYKTSVIYFVNTLGASFGVLISGFILVYHWGLRGAIISGGIIDLFVGAAIIVLCLRDKSATHADNFADDDADDDNGRMQYAPTDDYNPLDVKLEKPLGKREFYYTLLIISGITAASSFIYEIGWIRMLSIVLGSSTHSFELMLSAFILGLALGSFFIRNKIDGIKNAPRFLAIVQIIMGITAIMTLFIYSNMFEFMAFVIEALKETTQGYVLFNIFSHLICMIIMLPTTICAGMIIPLIINMLLKKGHGEQTIGKVYAVNTFGGIIGVILASWLLLELVGLKYLIIIGAMIDMGIGLFVILRFPNAGGDLSRFLAKTAFVVILIIAVMFARIDPVLISSGVFRYGTIAPSKIKGENRIVSHIDGKTASITLFRTGGDILAISTNGKPDASVGMGEGYSNDEYTMALLGILPLSIHDSAKTAAVIGMGAGMTSHFMLYDPNIENLDVVEIERAMVKLAQKMGPKVANTFTDPRSNIYIEDAKTFFSAQNRRYDIIVSEPSNPWVSGVSSLFSQEFFTRIRNHLNDGGILVQWFHTYEADVSILASIIKALGESFPIYEMYALGSDLIIIAAKDAGADISIKRDLFEVQAIAESLNPMGIERIDDLKLLRYGSRDLLEPFLNTYNIPANTDFHSFVDLHAAKYRFMGKYVIELADISEFIIPVQKIIFSDTAFIELSHRRQVPGFGKMTETQRAKKLYYELNKSYISVSEEFGAILVLDYTEFHPEKINYTQIQSAITQILQTTLPYLSAGEMREIWKMIEQNISQRKFSEYEAKWIEYFKAISTYDMPEMRRLSLELLNEETITDNYSNRVLITSLLTSSAVLGDTAGVWTVWNRYEERISPPPPIRAAKAVMQEMLKNKK